MGVPTLHFCSVFLCLQYEQMLLLQHKNSQNWRVNSRNIDELAAFLSSFIIMFFILETFYMITETGNKVEK